MRPRSCLCIRWKTRRWRSAGSGAARPRPHPRLSGARLHLARALPALAKRHTLCRRRSPRSRGRRMEAATEFRFTAHARRLAALLAESGRSLRAGRARYRRHRRAARDARRARARRAELRSSTPRFPAIARRGFRSTIRCTRCRAPRRAFACSRGAGFRRSGMGFREFYSDRSLFDDPAASAPYVDPLLASPRRM